MGFWTFLLWSYIITSAISAPTLGIRTYILGKEKVGKRKSIITGLEVMGLCLIIPYIGICGVIYLSYDWIRHKAKDWLEQDPTAPENKNNPNFVPPAKKAKKVKPIESRFDIMDL